MLSIRGRVRGERVTSGHIIFVHADCGLQVHFTAKISILSRIAFYFQRNFFTHSLDPLFSFDEFIEGAKMAYTVIRQISSNVKDPSKLDLLDGMVDRKLLQVILRPLSSLMQQVKSPFHVRCSKTTPQIYLSWIGIMAEKCTISTVRPIAPNELGAGCLCFDDGVYAAEVIGIALRTKQDDEARFSGASSSFEEDQARAHHSLPRQHGPHTAGAAWQARRRALLEQAEWMQIQVRFLAIEVPTVHTPSASADDPPHGAPGALPPRVERGPAEVIASTWIFEGRLWLVGPMDPAEDVPARWRKARTRNPELVWRLLKVSA
jgi:hypothetical protein